MMPSSSSSDPPRYFLPSHLRQESNSNSTKKGYWFPDEDQKLIQLYHAEGGVVDWASISSKFENRTAKQCRERWNEYLSPTIDHSPFTIEEDFIILRSQARLGNKWKEITDLLPIRDPRKKRTPTSVKVQWHCLERKIRRAGPNPAAATAVAACQWGLEYDTLMAPPAPPPPHWSHEAPQVTFQRPPLLPPQVSVQPQPQPQPLSFVQQPSPQLPAPPVALVSGPVSQLSPLNFTFSPPSAAQPLPSLSGFDAMSSQRRPLEFQSNLLLSAKKNSSSSSSGHSHLGVRSFAQFEEDSQSQSQPQPEIQAIQASDSKSLDQIINTIASEDTMQFTHLGSDESLAGLHYPPPPVEQHQCQSNIFDSSAATDAQYANTSSSSQLPYASAPNPAPRPLTFADYSPVYVTAQLPHLMSHPGADFSIFSSSGPFGPFSPSHYLSMLDHRFSLSKSFDHRPDPF